MSYFKKILYFAAIIILSVLFLFIFGCGKDTSTPDKSYEALQAFAVMQDETYPPTEIVSGVTPYFKDAETQKISLTEDPKTEAKTDPETETENTDVVTAEAYTEDTNGAILYVITPSGKKYHCQTCRTVKTVKQYLTKEEAEKSGYEPCKICNP